MTSCELILFVISDILDYLASLLVSLPLPEGCIPLGILELFQYYLSSCVFTMLDQAFVCSRIDYCNSLLIGSPKARL